MDLNDFPTNLSFFFRSSCVEHVAGYHHRQQHLREGRRDKGAAAEAGGGRRRRGHDRRLVGAGGREGARGLRLECLQAGVQAGAGGRAEAAGHHVGRATSAAAMSATSSTSRSHSGCGTLVRPTPTSSTPTGGR